MELTDSFRALVSNTCKNLKSTARRTFMADVAEQLGQRRAANEFGWGRDTIRKGKCERDSGIACVDAFSARGTKPLEQTRPRLIADIRDIAESFAASGPPRRASAHPLGVVQDGSPAAAATHAPVRVRAVLYFNPQMFVDQRLRASAQLQAVGAFVDDLNARLSTAGSRMTRERIAATIDRRLRKDDLLEAFLVDITRQQIAGRPRYSVKLSRDQPNWSRRRRFDGFSVVVAHPDLNLSAVELCRLYRAKDAIEKDFRVIKSFTDLRPVMHQTDAKVRAHVTICMLSLLLERTLRHKLKGKRTAAAALELLEGCRLNQIAAADDGMAAYTLTELTAEQAAVLRLLRLQRLGDQAQVADDITPR